MTRLRHPSSPALALALAFAACGAPERPGPDDVDDDLPDTTGADAGTGEPAADAGTEPESDAGGEPDAGTGETVDAGPPPAVTLELSVASFSSTQGQVCYAIFTGGTGFPDDESRAVRSACEPSASAAAGPLVVVLDASVREVGVSLFHDKNSNGELDERNILPGVPVPAEPFAFSNNPAIGFGAPSWDQCRVSVSEGTNALSFQLKTL